MSRYVLSFCLGGISHALHEDQKAYVLSRYTSCPRVFCHEWEHLGFKGGKKEFHTCNYSQFALAFHEIANTPPFENANTKRRIDSVLKEIGLNHRKFQDAAVACSIGRSVSEKSHSIASDFFITFLKHEKEEAKSNEELEGIDRCFKTMSFIDKFYWNQAVKNYRKLRYDI